MTPLRIYAAAVCVLMGVALIVAVSMFPLLRPAQPVGVALGAILSGYGLGLLQGMEWRKERLRHVLREAMREMEWLRDEAERLRKEAAR